MAGTGTGYPLTFRCAKCKVGRDWRHDDNTGTNWEPTGLRRELPSSQCGRGHGRALNFLAQYRCQSCGHVGWSRMAVVWERWLARGNAEVENG